MAQHSASDDATVKDTCYAMIQLEDPECAIDGSVVKRLPGDSVFFCVYNRIHRTARTYLSREDPKFKLVFSENSSRWGASHTMHGGIWELRREQEGGNDVLMFSDYVTNWPVMVEKWYSTSCTGTSHQLLEHVRFSPVDASAPTSAIPCALESWEALGLSKCHHQAEASPNPSAAAQLAPKDGSLALNQADLGLMTTRGLLENIAQSTQALRRTTEQTLVGQHLLHGRVDALQAQQQQFEANNQRMEHDFKNIACDFQTVANMHQDTQRQVEAVLQQSQEAQQEMATVHEKFAAVQRELERLRASSSSAEDSDWPTATTTKIEIDGYEVDVGSLASPVALKWWNYGRYEKVWLPPQTPVFDVERHGYTVDVQSSWGMSVPDHRAVSVRFLSFRSEGSSRKRRRHNW